MDIEQLRYPIGKLVRPEHISAEDLKKWIEEIGSIPAKLRAAVSRLTDEQLDTPYRPDGWTVRQVVHHMADSHMNSFIRFKLALTEDNPTIKPYEEAAWAELPDAKTAPIESSLEILDGLHKRWVLLLSNMSEEDLKRTFFHPGYKTTNSLAMSVNLYRWHGFHHLAHITGLIERSGW